MVQTTPLVAELTTVSVQALDDGSPGELRKLLRAASEDGVFYVDLQDSTVGRQILQLLPRVYQASHDYFDQSSDVKEKDVRLDQQPNQDKGFKKSDCDETFEMQYDEFNQETLRLSGPLALKAADLHKFSVLSHDVSMLLARSLSDGLGLKGNNRLEHFHQGESDSGLKLITEPALERLSDVGDNTHCDSGTLTMVWCEQWGLKIKAKNSDTWSFTEPLSTKVLVNVANSLQRLSQNRLHSLVHRVTQPKDGREERIFLSYFLRPDYITPKN